MPPLPPPLPPETRTVGQLVAETIRLYGARFWLSLTLGAPIAVAGAAAFDRPYGQRAGIYALCAPAFALALVIACLIASRRRAPAHGWTVPLAIGTAVFLVAAPLLPWAWLGAIVWFALIGLSVPAAVNEGTGLRSLRRGFELARADFVHALGSLAALVLVYGPLRLALALLLSSQADSTERAALVLADLVIGPLLFLGAALLYFDQEARSRIERP